MQHPCNFVRKTCESWEFGFLEIENQGTKLEKRHYRVIGKAPSYEEACLANSMSTKGAARGHHFDHNAKPLWKE